MNEIPHTTIKKSKKCKLSGNGKPTNDALGSILVPDSDSRDVPVSASIANTTGPTPKINKEHAELIKNIRIPLGWRIADPPAGSAELIRALPSTTRRNIICKLIEKQIVVVKSILSSAQPKSITDSGGYDGISQNKDYLRKLAAATDLLDSLNDILALQEHAINLRRRLAEQTRPRSNQSGCAKSAA
jgi:hypothetical protein